MAFEGVEVDDGRLSYTAIRIASACLSLETGTLRLKRLPACAAGITVKAIGIAKSHSICPVTTLPINPAKDENKTIDRLPLTRPSPPMRP